MLTRRTFGQIASCAICSLTGFIATDVTAGDTSPYATPGLLRKILSRIDGPVPGYVTIAVEVEIKAGAKVGRHTHPGVESSYVIAGSFELPIEGQPTKELKPGDVFQVPPNTPHAGGEPSSEDVHLLVNYVVEKDKPLASPA